MALFKNRIQPGAIFAIVVLYWRTFWDVLVGLTRRDNQQAVRPNLAVRSSRRWLLCCARDRSRACSQCADRRMALLIGGFAILGVERLAKPHESGGVANLTFRQSMVVGLVQCLAMVPGVSRSGATILGAMAMGVDRKTAAEFSFFLAVPTLAGATVLELAKHGSEIPSGMVGNILIGAAVSFVVAIVVVKAFVAIIQRHGFSPFAWYRIAAGGAALIWLALR